jgi:uncharacterized protein (TIGR02246 family)
MRVLCSFAILVFCCLPDVVAQTTDIALPAKTVADEAAIRANAAKFTEAFNRGDAKSIAALWTTNGEYVDDLGRNYVGREAIEKGYADFFATNPGAKLNLTIDSIRVLSEQAAIEDGQAILESPTEDTSTSSKYSVVHVKSNGQWLMASVRDAHTTSEPEYDDMADMEWLIGSWTAEEHGVKTVSVCTWLGNKRFVERKYTTKGIDGSETTGLQVIGWNAHEGHVQSWNFSPDGGVAVGAWSPTEDGWLAAVTGVTNDGRPTAAVNSLRRLDDNAYVWHSTERSLGEIALPDSGEVVIRRDTDK